MKYLKDDTLAAANHDALLLDAMSEVLEKVADEIDFKYIPIDTGLRMKTVEVIRDIRALADRLDTLSTYTQEHEDEVDCETCGGSGWDEWSDDDDEDCFDCEGEGVVTETVPSGADYAHWFDYVKYHLDPNTMLW